MEDADAQRLDQKERREGEVGRGSKEERYANLHASCREERGKEEVYGGNENTIPSNKSNGLTASA